jgi:hypothetical protein
METELIKSALTGAYKLTKVFYNSWSENKKEKAKQKAIDNLGLVVCLIPSKFGKSHFTKYIKNLNNSFTAYDFDQQAMANYKRQLHPVHEDEDNKQTALNQYFIEFYDDQKDKIRKLGSKVVIITSNFSLVNYIFNVHKVLPLVFVPSFDFMKKHLKTLELSDEETNNIEKQIDQIKKLSLKIVQFSEFEALREKIEFYFPENQ